MARGWKCATCRAINAVAAVTCEHCGTAKPARRSVELPAAPGRCSYDGAQLDPATWFCLQGNGYPLGCLCPFVCPLCRQRLEWSGACFGCHGSATPADRQTWTFPGARYETHDDHGQPLGDGQHWRKVLEANRAALPPDDNRRRTRTLIASLSNQLVTRIEL